MAPLHKHTYPYKYPPPYRLMARRGENLDGVPQQPMLPVRLNGMNFEALLDSGATYILIPKEIALKLGLPLYEKTTGKGVSGRFEEFRTDVDLTIGSGPKEDHIGKIVAYVPEAPNLDIPILIGQHPIFDIYKIVFEKYLEKFHLIPKE